MLRPIALSVMLTFAAASPATAWETIIGRWCDQMLPAMPTANREMTIKVDAAGAVSVASRFGDGSSSSQVLTEASGQTYLVANSDHGERYRIVGSTGDLQLIDDDGLIRVARRLENVAPKGECLR